jgi:hypothetical protein
MQAFRVSKGSLLFSTALKATQDAANELLLHQGVVLSEEQIDELARLHGSQYRASLSMLADQDREELIETYLEQWVDFYTYLQKKMVRLGQK